MSRVQQLRDDNQRLRERITHIQTHQQGNDLQAKITSFVTESKKNLSEMNGKMTQEQANQNQLLHSMTANYEALLKQQIQLLHKNKQLSEKKDHQEKTFNQGVEKLTSDYEAQIKEFQKKVKANVKRIQDLSNGGNMISRLLGNQRFRQVMQERGCSLDALENQCKLETVSQEVEEREKEIQEAQERSGRLDEELGKMHELIETMKNLLENMMKEKENILKQNVVLKEKLKQSEQLIAKLLGADMKEQDGEDEDYEDVQEEEEGEGEKAE